MAIAVTSSSHASNYHVFLSFRGPDTRLGFTGHLYKALTDKGIHTFIDDENLPRGEQIAPSLVKAIQESEIAIIVLSTHYASSSFCLDELVTIVDCAKSRGLLVIPVFYMVDPSDVRHLRGSYGDALANHDSRFPEKKLQKWKQALCLVADLSGYHLKDGDAYGYKFIGSIVGFVSKKINHPARLHVGGDYLVGLDSRVKEVIKLLDVRSDDGVHMVGIHGMGGVGKSTLARAVFNHLIRKNFDGLCFLENTREESNKHGLQHLQSILLSKVLGEKVVNLSSWREGASIIKDRLKGKKVLLVLDDVDKDDQLQAILGTPCWFCPCSMIIITTRDVQLLKRHQIEERYEVNGLNTGEALQLLTWKAFKKENVDPTYAGVLNRVVTYANGHPLALEVIGSNLFDKSIEDWESAINQYERIPPTQIRDILKVSFDALQKEEKSIFLDIACGIKGYELKEVEVMLNALHGYNVKYHVGVLSDKSLIKLDLNGIVKMHDLVQEMGRQIDLKKSAKQRKRLWLWEDIIEVLKHNKGTSKIEIIYLDVPISDREKIIEWDGNGFKKMKNLKILIIKNGKFSQGPKCLPNKLRVLEWWGYPSNWLPSDFQPHEFFICKLPYGYLTSFELDGSAKMFQNLTVLRFDGCESLTKISDLSKLLNLETLSFGWCHNLVTVDESIGCLNKVKEIRAVGCRKLEYFPPIYLTSLEKLNLSGTGLESFPEIFRKIENIERLSLMSTRIKELPFSFGNLVGLKDLVFVNNRNVVKLPTRILLMPKLIIINVMHSNGVKWIKEEENEGTIISSPLHFSLNNCNVDDDFFSTCFTQFARVRSLTLVENNITFLPECIKEFLSLRDVRVENCKHFQEIRGVPPNLKTLDVINCKNFQEIRGVPPNIESFTAGNCISLSSSSISMLINQELFKAGIYKCVFPGAWIPEWFDQHSKGPSSSFWFRNNFPHKILSLIIAPVEYYLIVVLINGKIFEKHPLRWQVRSTDIDYTYIFPLDLSRCECELALGWNHVEVTYERRTWTFGPNYEDFTYEYEGELETSNTKATGIHVVRGGMREEDIRFSNPSRKRKIQDDDLFYTFESDNNLLLKRPRHFDQQQNCIVSCLLNWACTSFPTQLLVIGLLLALAFKFLNF